MQLFNIEIEFGIELKSLFFILAPKTLVVPQLQGRHEIDLNYDLLEFYYNRLGRSYWPIS